MDTKQQLKSFFTEHWLYMAVSAACELNIFDCMDCPKSAEQLSIELNLNHSKLTYLLNALNFHGYLNKQDECYLLNAKSEYLTDKHPESLKYACLNWHGEHLTAWQNLSFTLQSGKSAFRKVYATSFFDYLMQHPEKCHHYHKAMYTYAVDDYKNLPKCIDFSQHACIMDVGGGYGALINQIKKMNNLVHCILFDLDCVVSRASIEHVERIAGNFFNDIPVKADAIILSRILHDWANDEALVILQNCFKSLPSKGTLYVIENGDTNDGIDLSLLSLNMSLMCDSFERNQKEYIELVQRVGFTFVSETPLNNLQTILIFKK